MTAPLDIVVFGLSLSSSWGNGHATTWRALLRGLHEEGHRVLFLERDVEWYRDNRDLADPDFCELRFYSAIREIDRLRDRIAAADAVIVGSYVPQGDELIDRLAGMARGVFAFYDIDTPVTLAKLARGEGEGLRREQIPLFDVYFSFTGGPTLARLEREFGARRALALHCAVDPARYGPVDTPKRWDLGYLGTWSADRQPALEKLLLGPARRLPHRRFVVAGPQYPADIRWPGNVERIEHLPPDRHREFYAAQRYTLNLTRADMIEAGWSPSVRLFEAAACGVPIVSDRWPGLGELLPEGEAVLIADGTRDVVELLESGRDGAPQARTARAIVLARHTGRARARELAQALRQMARRADVSATA